MHLQRMALMLASASLSASVAQADNLAGNAKKYEVAIAYDGKTYELAARVRETQTSMNACGLVTNRLEYMKDLSVLNVELGADFCPMDIVGQQEGLIKWQMPRSLRQSGKLKLRVNGEVIGEIEVGQDKAVFMSAKAAN